MNSAHDSQTTLKKERREYSLLLLFSSLIQYGVYAFIFLINQTIFVVFFHWFGDAGRSPSGTLHC
jgi:hypothetical protein